MSQTLHYEAIRGNLEREADNRNIAADEESFGRIRNYGLETERLYASNEEEKNRKHSETLEALKTTRQKQADAHEQKKTILEKEYAEKMKKFDEKIRSLNSERERKSKEEEARKENISKIEARLKELDLEKSKVENEELEKIQQLKNTHFKKEKSLEEKKQLNADQERERVEKARLEIANKEESIKKKTEEVKATVEKLARNYKIKMIEVQKMNFFVTNGKHFNDMITEIKALFNTAHENYLKLAPYFQAEFQWTESDYKRALGVCSKVAISFKIIGLKISSTQSRQASASAAFNENVEELRTIAKLLLVVRTHVASIKARFEIRTAAEPNDQEILKNTIGTLGNIINNLADFKSFVDELLNLLKPADFECLLHRQIAIEWDDTQSSD